MKKESTAPSKKRTGYTLTTRKHESEHESRAQAALFKYQMLKAMIQHEEAQKVKDHERIKELNAKLNRLRARIRNGRYSDAEI
jgi:anti-sigma28 factor (negative regulator of flagellin synthesis)